MRYKRKKASVKSNNQTNRIFFGNILIAAVFVFGLLAAGGYIRIHEAVYDQDLSEGVRVDGIDVSRMTYEDARQVVVSNARQVLDGVSLTLLCAGETAEFGAEEMGVSFDAEKVLYEAYSYDKNRGDSYAERYDKKVTLSQGMDFKTEFSVDRAALRETLAKYAARYYLPAINATAAFDKESGAFSYTTEQNGYQIDVDALTDLVEAKLLAGDYSAVDVEREALAPTVTVESLKEYTTRIASYETIAVFNENRNANIQLMCEALNGVELQPGDILSLNTLTGERTPEKGYMPAPAIIHGVLVDDVGGGVCQLAGTFYNAALLANLGIVERVRHTFPSSYLPIGQDSTINWDNKDLKIQNTTEHTVYIRAQFIDQKVIVEIYGQPVPDGITIKVQNDIIEEIKPSKPEIRYTNELLVGMSKVLRNAQSGYKVRVYRIYLQNGVEISREQISWDNYPALNKIILMGSNTYEK